MCESNANELMCQIINFMSAFTVEKPVGVKRRNALVVSCNLLIDAVMLISIDCFSSCVIVDVVDNRAVHLDDSEQSAFLNEANHFFKGYSIDLMTDKLHVCRNVGYVKDLSVLLSEIISIDNIVLELKQKLSVF